MPVNTMNWPKCFTTYSQTHEYESLLPEKDDARAFTRFAEHQANYNVACHELCFPRIYITTKLMDRRVMVFVCPLIIKLLVTLWALDHLQLGGPNISWAITTTSCCNAVLRLRITYEVAPMDHTMFPIWISAYNNFFIVLPSVDFTMEELRMFLTRGN